MRCFCRLFPVIFGICAGLNQGYAQEEWPGGRQSFYVRGSYTGDFVTNMSGGIQRGSTYLGLANIKAGARTRDEGWWHGGEFLVNAGNTHGGSPSSDLVGDFQGVSNIEAGNLTFMYELWYRQTLQNLSLTVGLQDLNANFAITENGTLFTNSSFGIHPSIADNIPSPIFPLTALGVILQWNKPDRFLLQTALFDGTPDDFENNPYNLDWKLSDNDGYLLVTELQLPQSLIRSMDGLYKLGTYYHEHRDSTRMDHRKFGVYLVADQLIRRTVHGEWSLFSQVGISPKHKSRNNYYLSLGMNLKGIGPGRPDDQAGIAIAHAGFGNGIARNETAIELTYLVCVNENIRFKPDLQYIIHPAGTTVNLMNSLVATARIELEF